MSNRQSNLPGHLKDHELNKPDSLMLKTIEEMIWTLQLIKKKVLGYLPTALSFDFSW